MKVKKKLRIFISNTFYPARAEGGEGDEASVASWELRVEGRLLEDHKVGRADAGVSVQRVEGGEKL